MVAWLTINYFVSHFLLFFCFLEVCETSPIFLRLSSQHLMPGWLPLSLICRFNILTWTSAAGQNAITHCCRSLLLITNWNLWKEIQRANHFSIVNTGRGLETKVFKKMKHKQYGGSLLLWWFLFCGVFFLL
jgi:hypothetical protein